MKTDLGTLHFGVELDTSKLTSDAEVKKILQNLKVDFDESSFNAMKAKLQQMLGSEAFKIKLTTDGTDLKELTKGLSAVGSDGKIAPFDNKNIEQAVQGVKEVAKAEKEGEEAKTQRTTHQQQYNNVLADTEKLLIRIKAAMNAGGDAQLLGIGARELTSFSQKLLGVDKNDATAVSNIVAEYTRLSTVFGKIVAEQEKANAAYDKTVNKFTEQSKKAYAEQEKAAQKAAENEAKAAERAAKERERAAQQAAKAEEASLNKAIRDLEARETGQRRYNGLLKDMQNLMDRLSSAKLAGGQLNIDTSRVEQAIQRLRQVMDQALSMDTRNFGDKHFVSEYAAGWREVKNELQAVAKEQEKVNAKQQRNDNKAVARQAKEEAEAARKAAAENEKWAASMSRAQVASTKLELKIRQMEKALNELSNKGIDTTKLKESIEQMRQNLAILQSMAAGVRIHGTTQSFVQSPQYQNPVLQANAAAKEHNAQATNHLSESERNLAAAIKGSTDSIRSQSQVLSDLKTMAMQYLSVWGAQSFIHNIIELGGQLEQQRLSISAILQDSAQANYLFGQIKDLAVRSPFGVQQLDAMTKQLAAYGFQYSELFDWTKRLADISAATGTSVDRLALALGHVRSEGALSGYTLRQFSMGNIPLLQKLSENLGKTTQEIRKMVRGKEIGYEEVLDVMRQLTDEGGMFFKAQETMSEALNAKFKNLRDTFQIMYSEMAEGAPGDALKKVAVVLTDIARSWRVLMPMVTAAGVAFGVMKASTMALNYQLEKEGVITGKNTAKKAAYTAATNAQIKSVGRLTLTLRGLGSALVSLGKFVFSPVTLGMAAVEGLIYAWSKHNEEVRKAAELTKSYAETARESQKNLGKMLEKVSPFDKSMDASALKSGIDQMTEAIKNYAVNSQKILNTAFGADEENKVMSLAEKYQYLRGELEKTAAMYEEMKRTKDAFEFGINATDSGWFDDNVETDLTQYAISLKEFNDYFTTMIADYEDGVSRAIEAAKKASPEFRKVSDELANDAERLKWLYENRYQKVSNGQTLLGLVNETLDNDSGTMIPWNLAEKTKSAEREALKELDNFINATEARFKEAGYKFEEGGKQLSEAQVANLLKQSKDWLERHPEWENIYDVITEKLDKRWGVKIEPDPSPVEEQLPEWMQALQDELDGTPVKIKADMSMEMIVDEMKKAHDKAQTTINKLGPIAINAKIDIAGLTDDVIAQYGPGMKNYNQELWEVLKELKRAQDTAKKLTDTASKRGVTLEGMKKDGSHKLDSSANKAKRKAEEENRLRVKQAEVAMKMEEDLAKQQRELEDALADARIAGIKNNGERERAEREEQFRKEERQIKLQVEQWKKDAYELARKEFDANNKDKTKNFYTNSAVGKAGWRSMSLTNEQYRTYIAQEQALAEKRKRWREEQSREDAQAMLDYLKEFGTIQERRYAIQREWDIKIENETRSAQKKLLEAEKQKALDAFDIEVLKAEIDWSLLFDGLGSAFEEEIKETLDKVEKYIRSEDFKRIEAKEKAEFVKLRNQLSQKTGSGVGVFVFSIYGQIAEDMKSLQQASLQYKYAQQQHTAAIEEQMKADQEVTEAKEKLEKAVTEEEKRIAEENLKAAKLRAKMAGTNATITGQQQNTAKGEVVVAQGELQESSEKAQKALEGFGSALNQIKSGTLRGFADGLINLYNSLVGNGKTGGLAQLGKAGGIIGLILSVIDALGENPGKTIGDIIDKIFDVVVGILDEIGSGELVGKIAGSILAGVSKMIYQIFDNVVNSIGSALDGGLERSADGIIGEIGNSFTEAFSSMNDNHEEQLAKQKELTVMIDSTTQAFEKLSRALEESYGVTAMETAERQKALHERNQENMVKGLNAALWDNYGGGHSDYWHWNQNTSLAKMIAERYGLSFNGDWNSLFNDNNAKEVAAALRDIRESEVDWWYTLIRSGHDAEEVENWLNQLADSADKYEEIDKQLKEQLTGTTAENVFGGLMDALIDLANGSEDAMDDIADNWQEMVNKMVVNSIIGQKMMEDLKAWYEKFAATNPEDTDAIDNLRKEYNDIVNWGVSEVKRLQGLGVLVPLDKENKEETKKYFENLLDSWKSTLTDLSKSTEDWKNELIDQIFGDLVESTILNAPFEVVINEWVTKFDDFGAYLEHWTDRYKKVIEDASLTEEQRIERINALIAEQTSVRDRLAEQSKELAAGLGKEITEEFSNSLDSLGDTLIDALLDTEKDAEQMGKEIAQNLIKEMLAEMLKQAKYADRIADIRQMWQDILSGKDTAHTLEDVLSEITALNNDIAEDESIKALADKYQELGKAAEEAAEKADSAFQDLHSSFLDALTDMEGDAESFRKMLEEKMLKDFMDKNILNKPFTAGLDGRVKDFTGIDDYIDQWTELYEAAAEAGNQELVDALLDELAEVYNLTIEQAKDLRERMRALTEDTNKDTTFTEMEDNFVSALMDMESDITDFADDMKKTIVQKLIESFMVSEKIKPMLDELQKTFDYVMGQKGWSNEQRLDFMIRGGIGGDGEHFMGIDSYEQDIKDLEATVDGLLTYAGFGKKTIDELLGSITSNLTTMLADGEKTAEDFSYSLKESLVNSLLEAYTATEEFQEGLAGIKQQMQEAIESGDPEQIKAAEKAAEDFYNNATAGVKAYTDAIKKAQVEQDTTFKDMGSELISALTDIDNDAEDWAKILGQKIADKIFEGMVGESQLLDKIQDAFNEAVSAATIVDADGNSHIDWQAVANNSALKEEVTNSKAEFNEMQKNWEALCASFGIELERSTKEGFSNLRGAFTDSLYDIDATAESFGKQIGKTMAEQMVDAYLDSRYGSQMKTLNEEWAAALESGNTAALESIKQRVIDLYRTIADPEDLTLQGLLDAIREIETQLDTTFSGMGDSWASALMDMEKTAEDWAKDVGKIITEKIIKEMIVPTFIQPLLDELQGAMNSVLARENATWQDVVGVAQGYMGSISEAFNAWHPVVEQILNSFGIFREETEQTEEKIEYALGDLKSEFVSALMDVENTAEKFSESIGRTIAQAFIEKFVLGEAFDQQMKVWQQRFEDINTSGYSEDERMRQVKQLRDAITAAKEGYVSQSLAIQELLGLNAAGVEDQEAVANIADKITYEQADQLLGINMAMEMTLEQILATLRGSDVNSAIPHYRGQDAVLAQQILAAVGSQAGGDAIGTNSDIFNRLGYTNEYLRAIRDSNDAMLNVVNERLSRIEGRLARL